MVWFIRFANFPLMNELTALLRANMHLLQVLHADPLFSLEAALLASREDEAADLWLGRVWTAEEVRIVLDAVTGLMRKQ